MRRILTGALVACIRVYQLLVSPILGPSCRFMPSCSHYAIEAIQTHGAWRGVVLAVRRIGRCHPFHPGGFDPVPDDLTSVSPRVTETVRGS